MTRRKEPRRPRSKRTWQLNPVQKTHSAARGAELYSRRRKRDVPREEIWVKLHQAAHRPPRIVVLLSGEGKQLDEILSYIDNGTVEAEIVAVIGDDSSPRGVGAASERGIRTLTVDPAGFGGAEGFSREINRILDRLNPDIVVVDGFAESVRLRDKSNRRVTYRAETLVEIAAT